MKTRTKKTSEWYFGLLSFVQCNFFLPFKINTLDSAHVTVDEQGEL